jgi:serine/threonine protein kinase
MREKVQKSYWLEVGTILDGHYRIDKVLEEGGFGIVYLGYDTTLKMKVSIKEYFPREMADRLKGTKEILPHKGKGEVLFSEGLEKFLSEAQILARCNHIENVVVVRDFFYQFHTAYLIMEYVEGTNIKSYVRQNGAMEPQKVLEYMRPILKSLEQIHKTGLIHRDISPENIILTPQGKIYLIDFGSTRPYSGKDYQTMTVFFKRGYAAEEQYRERGEQGPWTDVYSLCATMYFMLTGETPLEAAQRNIRDTLKQLSQFTDIDLPLSQKKAITKGMEVKREKRYADVSELYRHLYETKEESGFPWSKNFVSVWWKAAGIVLIAGLAAVSVWTVSMPKIHRAESKAPQEITSDIGREPSDIARVTPSPSPHYMVADVKGKTVKKAKALLRKKGDESLTITVIRKYSKSTPKGKVMRQSVHGGVQYEKGEIEEIVLTVSKGKKPKKVTQSTTAPTTTKQPDLGEQAAESTSEKKKSDSKKQQDLEEDYAGDLPW